MWSELMLGLRPIAHKSALWLLRKLNPGDIRIRHHYTGDRLTLDAFKHKGYWYHGRRREANSMRLFLNLISAGDTVLEAGGHIGYVTMYLAQLCGATGQVVVFEPAPDNLRYLRQNVSNLAQVRIVEKAVGSANGPRDLFVEELTGQNNSFFSEYEVFQKNAVTAGYDAGGYRRLPVDVVRIDDYCAETGMRPDFVKIDIEGAELEALRGMEEVTARTRPRFMVEVSREIAEVFTWFNSRGYLVYNDKRERLNEPCSSLSNIFCLHPEAHVGDISRLKLDGGSTVSRRDGV
jgi:FkbM family methyltransferase